MSDADARNRRQFGYVPVPRDLQVGSVVTAVLVEQNGTLLIAGLWPSTAPKPDPARELRNTPTRRQDVSE